MICTPEQDFLELRMLACRAAYAGFRERQVYALELFRSDMVEINRGLVEAISVLCAATRGSEEPQDAKTVRVSLSCGWEAEVTFTREELIEYREQMGSKKKKQRPKEEAGASEPGEEKEKKKKRAA